MLILELMLRVVTMSHSQRCEVFMPLDIRPSNMKLGSDTDAG